MDSQLCNDNGIQRWLGVNQHKIWCDYTASYRNSFQSVQQGGHQQQTPSRLTALLMISTIRNSGSWLTSFEYSRHAKSQCSPSSQLISSLLKLSPGIRPRFLSQKMAQKDPEKEMPSTVENAMVRLTKLALVVSHLLRAHCAFRWMQGTVSMACGRCIFLVGSLMYVSIDSLTPIGFGREQKTPAP